MLTREQVKMARAALGWGIRDLAQKAGIAANTVTRFENGGDALNETLAKIKLAFEEGGLSFIPENGGGDGVRFRERRHKPDRSSS